MSLPFREGNIFTFCLSPACATRLTDVSLLLDLNPGITLDPLNRNQILRCCFISDPYRGYLPSWRLQPFQCSDQGLMIKARIGTSEFEILQNELDICMPPEVRRAETLEILQRLLNIDPTLGATITQDTIQKAIKTSARPEAVKLLLDSADTDQFTEDHFWKCLETALSGSHVAVDTIEVLLDYGRARELFSSLGPNSEDKRPSLGDLIHHRLSLANIKTVEKRIEMARSLDGCFGSLDGNGWPTGPDLVRGLRDACASSLPGALEVCKILDGLGASKHVQVDDLVKMTRGAARSRESGLLEWVMNIASLTGQKDALIVACRSLIKPIIYEKAVYTSAKYLLDQGVEIPFKPGLKSRSGQYWDTRCASDYHQDPRDQRDNLMESICGLAYHKPCAPELVKSIFESVPKKTAIVLANFGQKKSAFPYESQLTPAYRLLIGSYPSTYWHSTKSEASRLHDQEVLQLLLDNGAEMHIFDRRHYHWDEPFPPNPRTFSTEGWGDHPFDRNINPISHAINFHRWDLLDIMLTAQPLRRRNCRLGTTYLEEAVLCWQHWDGFLPPCPDTLEVLLRHLKLDSMDYPLPQEKKPALYVLLESFSTNYPFQKCFHITDQNHHEECKCSEDIKIRKDHLSRCVYLLLKHGAQWTAKCPETGQTSLDFIMAQRSERGYCFVPFTRHNWDELEKHLVLDWEEYGDSIPEGFNPFEMDDIKAVKCGSAPVKSSKRKSLVQKVLHFRDRA